MFKKFFFKENENFWDIPKLVLIIINIYWGYMNNSLFIGVAFAGIILFSMYSNYKILFPLSWKKYIFYIFVLISGILFLLFFLGKQQNNLLIYYGNKLPYLAFLFLIEDLFGQKRNDYNFLNKKKLYRKNKNYLKYSQERLESLAFSWPKKYTAVIGFYPRAIYMIFMYISILAIYVQKDMNSGFIPFIFTAIFIFFVLNDINNIRDAKWKEWLIFIVLLTLLSVGTNSLVKFAQYKSQELYAERFAKEYSNSGWFNAFQQNTQIGKVGELSDSQDLLLRVDWDKPVASLLPAAYFNITPNGTQWKSNIFGNKFIPDDSGSRTLPDANMIPLTEIINSNSLSPENTVYIDSAVNLKSEKQQSYKDNKSAILIGTPLKYKRGETALPLPAGTHVILGTDRARVSSFANGSVMYSGYDGEVNIQSLYSDNPYIQLHPPLKTDLAIPKDLIPTIEEVSKQIGIDKQDAVDVKVKKIHDWYYKNFTYTIKFDVNGKEKTISDFLLKDRQGHCEYFASTTSLLLRYVGIPTRYTVGFLVQERHPEEEPGMFWVRQRDAHAWTVYWNGQGWQSLDTTPPMSDDMEDGKNIFSTLNDAIESFKYKVSKIDTSDWLDSTTSKIIFGVLLFIIITTLILTRKRWNKVDKKVEQQISINYPDIEIDFEKEMEEWIKTYPKDKYEPWGIWAKRTENSQVIKLVNSFYGKRYS